MKRIAFSIAVLVALSGCNAAYVDQAPAIAVADKFYGALKAGDGNTAFSLFSPEFKSSQKEWPRLLGSLQEKNGVVASAELRESHIAGKDRSPCYVMTYSVKRGSLGTDETLFVCRAPKGAAWAISGHSLTRLDTKQSIAGGMVPVEIGVHVP